VSKFPSFNPDVAAALHEYTARSPYGSLVGIEIVEARPGGLKARLAVTEKLGSGVGAVHGGAIVSLVDHCASLAVYPLVEVGKWVATLELKVNYVSAVPASAGGTLEADAQVLALKKRVGIVRVDVRHVAEDRDELVAAAQATVYVRDPLR
jgi:uncharacterized protein (TIGR00369 family)